MRIVDKDIPYRGHYIVLEYRPIPTELPEKMHLEVARWCSGRASAGLVIERSRVRLPAGALPGSLGQLSLPSLRVGKSSTILLAGVKVGRVHLRRVAGNTVIPYGK